MLWTALLVVCPVAASVVSILKRPGRSDSAGPGVAGSPAQAAAGAGSAAGTMVSLTFNFGTVSQYDYARSPLRRHGVHGTFYVTPDRVDAPRSAA